MNPQQQIMQVATGYMASSALYIAAHLKIADLLAVGSKSTAELAASTKTMEDPLYRVLRLLISLGIFEENAPRQISLNLTAQALRTDLPGSMHGMAVFLPDPFHFRCYAELLHCVQTGKPAVDKVMKMPIFEYLAGDPEYSTIFNNAMTALSAPVIGAALEAYDFSVYNSIVDVAGGHGEVLMAILQACPNSSGVLADLEHVVQGSIPRISSAGLQQRCKAVTCDFFKAVPEGGDAYVMKHIIHDWDDERAVIILKNIASAMGNKKGHVVLLESVIPSGSEPDLGKFIDIEMLALPGGKERTREEFAALFTAAGFQLTKVVPTASPLSVVEAIRV
tara:strand:+ start:5729 stop:6733 length:1005 start_codon:yes stop_codon:yes gene_type:complete